MALGGHEQCTVPQRGTNSNPVLCTAQSRWYEVEEEATTNGRSRVVRCQAGANGTQLMVRDALVYYRAREKAATENNMAMQNETGVFDVSRSPAVVAYDEQTASTKID